MLESISTLLGSVTGRYGTIPMVGVNDHARAQKRRAGAGPPDNVYQWYGIILRLSMSSNQDSNEALFKTTFATDGDKTDRLRVHSVVWVQN